MKVFKSKEEKDLFTKDMAHLVSKALIGLGEKKCQLPWFVSSALNPNQDWSSEAQL